LVNVAFDGLSGRCYSGADKRELGDPGLRGRQDRPPTAEPDLGNASGGKHDEIVKRRQFPLAAYFYSQQGHLVSEIIEGLAARIPEDWGVEPVPPERRMLRPFDFAILWGDLAISLLVMVAGSLLVPGLGTKDAVLAIVVGTALERGRHPGAP